MINSNQAKLLIITFMLIALGGFLLWKGFQTTVTTNIPQTTGIKELPAPNPPQGSPSANLHPADSSGLTPALVTRVVDGDTIEVNINGSLKKLRYIGVNTPETVDPRKPVQCFGKEASDENKSLLSGKTVYLEKDVSETDKFGRLLRYVYLKLPDNQVLFVNDYLVRTGFAQVDTFPPDVKYVNKFLEAQNEARTNHKGLWSKCR